LPDPTMPLGRFPRLCGIPFSRVQPIGSKSTGRILSSSSRSSRVSFQLDLVARRNGIDSSSGLPFPIAPAVSKVHFTRACLPATFRLQGLITLLTVYSLRTLPTLFQIGSASGIHPSKLTPPERYSWVSPEMNPYAVSSHVPLHFGNEERSAGLGFRALTLSEIPGKSNVISVSTAGCSLGVGFPEFGTRTL
jgi:hypothetical protein